MPTPVPTITPDTIARLIEPYLLDGTEVPAGMYRQLALYLDLLLKWNARTNLTAIREPEEIVRRHFGESLFAGQHLNLLESETLLDFGSGAGFPGLPMQLLLPTLRVTLAESRNKKAAFLREAVRTLSLTTEVWAGRVEAMPAGRRFDVVALRAVDNMDAAIAAASVRAAGRILLMTTLRQQVPPLAGFKPQPPIALPGGDGRCLIFLDREA